MKPICVNGHARTPESVSTGQGCKLCLAVKHRAWVNANRDRLNAYRSRWAKARRRKLDGEEIQNGEAPMRARYFR